MSAYFTSIVARMGGTPLDCAIADVIGSCFAHGPEAHVSTAHILTRCIDRGVVGRFARGASYGSVVRVLELLRRQGCTWLKAHVARWHGPLDADPASWPRLRPRRHADGSFRLPARRLRLIGFAATLVAFLAAGSIEPEANRSAEKVPSPRVHAPSVSIQPAAMAGVATTDAEHVSRSIAEALARVSAWRPPDDAA